MWSAEKATIVMIIVARRGSLRVSRAIAGAPTIMPTANPVMRRPACGIEMARSALIGSRMPAIMNSEVPRQKITAASR